MDGRPLSQLSALLILLALVSLTAPALARSKTDLVFLNNGDRITGEIKLLDRGILQLGTDDIGTLKIEWEDIDSLVSVYQFRVEDHDGAKYFGAISLSRGGHLRVLDPGARADVPQEIVVAITPLEASFWQQLDGSISLGFSYTKSNALAQLTTDINVRRRTPTRLLELDMSSIATSQEDEETRRREDLSLSYSRLFEGPLFAVATGAAQANDELGLDLRLLFAPGMGLNLVQSNSNDLVSTAGLSVNREWSEPTSGNETYNLEGFLSVKHSIFRYDFPKTDITTDATVYPSLTSWGRVRAEIDISASREIVSDFTFVLSFYDSYDSDPPAEGATRNDYGIVTSVGWTF
ncbi:MAG TPA: DUF481 domain-containing protein [Candidatus Eisenbacteria bacterium]|nr:DUF481 domain-containing protein [Candidatus Eisenbacteria bacterium]